MTEIEARILEALEAEAPAHGIDIVDVEVTGAGSSTVLCVRIDHVDESLPAITLEDVAAEGAWINAVLDELDPFAGSYSLEVSSPGMDRPLRRAADFERFAGSTVKLETTAAEGRRRYTGELVGMEGDDIVLIASGERCQIPIAELKRCRIKPDFDFSQDAKKR